MILLIAGLNKIPQETYEAAALDGAAGWRLLRWITLPQLKAASAAVIMLLLNAHLKDNRLFVCKMRKLVHGKLTCMAMSAFTTVSELSCMPQVYLRQKLKLLHFLNHLKASST